MLNTRGKSPASGAGALEAGRMPPPWRVAQAALDALFSTMYEGVDTPASHTYQGLVCYLAEPAAAPVDGARAEGDYAAAMSCRSDPRGGSPHRRAVQQIRRAAGGAPVYLADGRAFVREALAGEFPELEIFGLDLEDSFAESGEAGVYVETARFADLRSLSRMRREVRRAGLRHPGRDPALLVARLLGLPAR